MNNKDLNSFTYSSVRNKAVDTNYYPTGEDIFANDWIIQTISQEG